MPDRHVVVNRRGLAFFQDALRMLDAARIPFLVGGAYAAHVYTGIHRNTRDFDVFSSASTVRKCSTCFIARGTGPR